MIAMRRFFASLLMGISIALTALRTHVLRSVLTMLGVMIGVLAVILSVSVGQGAKIQVMDSVSSLGSNMAIIIPVPDNQGARTIGNRGRLTERDVLAISRQIDGVAVVAPQLRAGVQMVAQGNNTNTTVIGVTPDYAIVSNLQTDFGRNVSEADVRTAARVVALGPSVAEKLFGKVSALGQVVRINRVPFTVIGILESKGNSFGNDNDDLVLMPISAARQRLSGLNLPGPDDLNVAFVGFQDGVDVIAGKKAIRTLLKERYKVRKEDVTPFTIRTTEEFMRESQKITGIFQMVLVAIASISLLVGGIGIMNIMLVSVTERTREIGLRMALGARRSDIRNQFLIESAVLCLIGGAIGLALAILLARIFEKVAEWPAPIGPGIVVFALTFSAIVGVLFGAYPAYRASRLSPIEALRSE
jgi:putative ABC transport system permease protein